MLGALADNTYAEKLPAVTVSLADPGQALKSITDVIDQIREDQQSKELFHSLMQKEISSIQRVKELSSLLNLA